MKMKKIAFILFVFVLSIKAQGQQAKENLSGQVSFVGSQNVYVKFKSTEGISAGDTLYTSSNGDMLPVLIVTNLSSVSCVCTVISSVTLKVADVLIARPGITVKTPVPHQTEKYNEAIDEKEIIQDTISIKLTHKQKVRGSLSAYSYSDFSNTSADNSLRLRYTLSLDARNIANSRFSAETYASFRHKKDEWADVQANLFNALKIYTLAVKYELDESSRISLGRRINPKISSIGAIDGLQYEKTYKRFTFGALTGFRPDYTNYGFNPSLFQYGAYAAFNTKGINSYSENSLAFMQQTNHSKTDRRFLYFQHSSNLTKNIYLFGTFELDLFKLENGVAKSTVDPTGLYLSLRYKMTKRFTVSGSYDARKNVMYYETYKSLIDTLFEKELRQGFRLQTNYKLTKDIMVGLQSGYRFLKSDPEPSKNAYAYVSYNRIPGININATLMATYLETSYLNGKIFGISINRDLAHGKIQTGLGYRYINYQRPENLLDISQNIAEANVYWQFHPKISLSVNYEGTLEDQNRYNRIYLQVRKRF